MRHKISVNRREFRVDAANRTKSGHCSLEVFVVKCVLLVGQVGPIDAATSIDALSEVGIENSSEIHFGIQKKGTASPVLKGDDSLYIQEEYRGAILNGTAS